MTGSDESNEDLVSGRTNRANDTTTIWAERASSEPLIGEDTPGDYNGSAILVVEPAGDPENPDAWENNDFTPTSPVDGIIGTAWSGNSSAITPGHIGGVGVTGNGGTNQGTGVLGKGGGKGVGGIGVLGIGGSQSEPSWDATLPPGTGVVAQGGRQTDFNTLRLPHGAGVVALAGGRGKPVPPLTDTPGGGASVTGGVGVFAQGADADFQTVPIGGTPTPVGPLEPGTGVLGRGGVSDDPRSQPAAGVVGLAGGVPIPNFSDTANAGVFGGGLIGVFGHGTAVGVHGQGDSGAGIRGNSAGDRGGIFEADRSAQVQLSPHHIGPLPAPVTVTPTAIPAQREGPALPKDGRGGDLMAVIDDTRQCTLWFCVKDGNGGPARWAQVLLGPPFDGRA